jgi:hypothetical protein
MGYPTHSDQGLIMSPKTSLACANDELTVPAFSYTALAQPDEAGCVARYFP